MSFLGNYISKRLNQAVVEYLLNMCEILDSTRKIKKIRGPMLAKLLVILIRY